MSKEVPSAHLVDADIGPCDGAVSTVYLVNRSDTTLPWEVRQQLLEYLRAKLHKEAVVEEKLNSRALLRNCILKIEFIGLSPSEALRKARALKFWFFQNIAPPSIKRRENKQRRARRQQIKRIARRERKLDKVYCRQWRMSHCEWASTR